MTDYETFVRAQLPRLSRYAVMLTGERDQAADLVQDVLVKVFRRWKQIADSDVENMDGQYGNAPADLGTTYDIGVATAQNPAVVVTSGPASLPTGSAGRTVQGHSTRYSTDRGYTEFYVLNAVHGAPIMIGSDLPLAQIYQIADGLVLPR